MMFCVNHFNGFKWFGNYKIVSPASPSAFSGVEEFVAHRRPRLVSRAQFEHQSVSFFGSLTIRIKAEQQ
jgi:hypothetical protein